MKQVGVTGALADTAKFMSCPSVPISQETKRKWVGLPGGPVLKTLCFYCRGLGFNPWPRN